MKNLKNAIVLVFISSVILAVTMLNAVASYSDAEIVTVGIDNSKKTVNLYYGDILSLDEYSSVTIINEGSPSSMKVGYGVANQNDDEVITYSNGKLYAVGVGEAEIRLDSYKYTVNVYPAPISMFLLIGQSNMSGREGDITASVACPEGQVYSTYAHGDKLTVSNAPYFVPSALCGENSLINTKGTRGYLSDYPVNSLTVSGEGKEGLDSGLAYQWNKMTGDKVWVINAAQCSTAISLWVKGGSEYEQAVALFKAAQKVMANEIKAGHFVLKNYGVFWLHGCADGAKTAEYYYENFMSMHNSFTKELIYDINGDGKTESFEFFDVIMPRAGGEYLTGYRRGTYSEEIQTRYYQSFLDLEMRGHRVAQYYICNNPDNNIYLVSNLGDSWVTMPDGTDGVSEYFSSQYPNGKVNYPVQKVQISNWYIPSTPYDVHDNIHYNQIGYNEIGIDAARNAAYTHNRAEKPEDVETTVTFYNWTGYCKVDTAVASQKAKSKNLVVPVVYPVYESKNVEYHLSDEDMSYYLYDITYTGELESDATITAIGASGDNILSVEAEVKPGKPSYVNANAESDCVTLTWSKVSGASGYRIYQYTSSGWKSVRTTIHTSYTLTGLTANKKYIFAIRAYTYQLGEAVFSSSYTKITVETKLETPTLRVASTAAGRATLAWYDINGEGGYQIWYCTSKNGTYKKLSNYKADTIKVYKNGFTSGKTYYFKVRAYKKTADGYSYSNFSDVKALKIK